MKRFLVPVIVILLALFLLACNQAQPTVRTVVETREVIVEVTTVVEGTPQVLVVTATPAPVEATTLESEALTTLVSASGGGFFSLDPAVAYDGGSLNVMQNIYETLLLSDRGNPNEFVPQLATDWEISADETQYTFTIREGVRFHEGGELDAEDVAYSLQRGLLTGGPNSAQWLLMEPFFGPGIYDITQLLDPEGNLVGDRSALQEVDAAELEAVCQRVQEKMAVESNTVVMTLEQPWGPFLITLINPWAAVMDREWVAEQGGWDGDCATWQDYYALPDEENPFTEQINGTGPFVLERYSPGEELVLARFDDYWRTEPLWEGGPSGPAALERVVMLNIEESGTVFAMAQVGDVDLFALPAEQRAQMDPLVGEICSYDTAEYQFHCAPASGDADGPIRKYVGALGDSRDDLLFNFAINNEGGNPYIGSGQFDGNGVPPDFFSDIHVRRAFNYCFDRELYSADVLPGIPATSSGLIHPVVLGGDDAPIYPYDLEQCASELEAAWEGQVAEHGFRVQLVYVTGTIINQIRAEILQANLAEVDPRYRVELVGLTFRDLLSERQEGRLPLYSGGWAQDYPDPHSWAQPFTNGTLGRSQALPEELLEQFSELIDEGVTTTDPEERVEIYERINELDYENAPAIRGMVWGRVSYEQRWVDSPEHLSPFFFGTYFYLYSKQ